MTYQRTLTRTLLTFAVLCVIALALTRTNADQQAGASIATSVKSGPATDEDVVAFEINPDRTPSFVFWCDVCTSVGWYYTPKESYSLSRVETKFRLNLGAVCPEINYNRIVTIEVLTDRRSEGGVLLGSAQFNSAQARDQFGGASFAELIPLEAGVTYFIGFRNVQLLGVNFTDEPADKLCGYLDRDALGGYGILMGDFCPQPNNPTQNVIMRLYKAVK